jgi:uncharacterized protein
MKLIFEWHEAKAEENLRKHNVNFEQTKTVFNDPFLLTFPDVRHSEVEERFINIGTSSKGDVLIVIHTERQGAIRIISSRKATTSERKTYEEGGF